MGQRGGALKLALLALLPLIASLVALGPTNQAALANATQNNGCLGVTGTFTQFAIPIGGTGAPNPVTVPNPITLSGVSLTVSVSAALIATGVTAGLVSASDNLADIGAFDNTHTAAANAGVNNATVAAGAAILRITGTNTTQGTQVSNNSAAVAVTFYATADAVGGNAVVYTAISSPPSTTPDPTRTGTVLVGDLSVMTAFSNTTWTPTGAGSVVFSEQNVVPSSLTAPTVGDQAVAPIFLPVRLGAVHSDFHCWTGTVNTAVTPNPLVPAAPSAIDTVAVTTVPTAPTCSTPQAASVGGAQSVTVTPNCTNNNPPFNLATSTVTIVTAPTNGTAAVQAGNTILYTNNGGTATTDTFTYTVANTVGASNLVTVNISVLTNSCTVSGTPATCSLHQVLIVPVAPSTLSMSQAANQDVLGCGFHSLPTSPTQPCDSTPLTLNGQPQYAAGALSQVTVVNARGTDAGWSLTGQVSDFIDGTRGPTNTCSPPAALNVNQTPPNNHCIPGGNLGWFPAASIVDLAVPGDTAAVTAGGAILPPLPAPRPGGLTPVPGLHDAAQMLCSSPANQSGGTFACNAGLIVAVPASAAAALTPGYTATLTLTLA